MVRFAQASIACTWQQDRDCEHAEQPIWKRFAPGAVQWPETRKRDLHHQSLLTISKAPGRKRQQSQIPNALTTRRNLRSDRWAQCDRARQLRLSSLHVHLRAAQQPPWDQSKAACAAAATRDTRQSNLLQRLGCRCTHAPKGQVGVEGGE